MSNAGAPTKYKPEYCKALIDFFDVELTEIDHEGKKEATPLPTFEKFCVSIGIHKSTMLLWCETHSEFSDAYRQAKKMQKDHLIQNSLAGRYNAQFAKFVAINCTDMVDKVVQDVNQHSVSETYEEFLQRTEKEAAQAE